jgi:hypothetical protein
MAANNYNADTAWNYLGTGLFDGRGAYDYAAVSRLRPPAKRRRSTDNQLVDPTGLINSYFNTINNYPEAALNSALSGKYFPIL